MNKQQKQNDAMDTNQILQMLQQKIGNLELTVHAMMSVLEKEDLLDEQKINEEAQNIVKEMQELSEKDVEKKVKDINTDED